MASKSKSRRAGGSTRDLAEWRSIIRASFALVALVVGWVFFKLLPHAHSAGIGAVIVLFIVCKFALKAVEKQIDIKFAEEKRAIRGAVAEENVGEILDQLGSDYVVLHDVRCQFGNIDHVVLSKQHGVFLIETKAHGGRVKVVDSKILVNGKPAEKDFVAQTHRNTYWLAGEIEKATGVKLWVTPLIIFTNAFVERSRPLRGITITNKKYLLPALEQGRKSIPADVWAAKAKIAELITGVRIDHSSCVAG